MGVESGEMEHCRRMTGGTVGILEPVKPEMTVYMHPVYEGEE